MNREQVLDKIEPLIKCENNEINNKHYFVNNLGGSNPTFCKYCLMVPSSGYHVERLIDHGLADIDPYLREKWNIK